MVRVILLENVIFNSKPFRFKISCFSAKQTFYVSKSVSIGGTRADPRSHRAVAELHSKILDARPLPRLWGPNSFNFIFGKFWQNRMLAAPRRVSTPTWRKSRIHHYRGVSTPGGANLLFGASFCLKVHRNLKELY